MPFNRKLLSLLFVSLFLCLLESEGQSLRGKVIYISSSQEVLLKFRSAIAKYDFTPKESAALFGRRLTNKKSLSISTSSGSFPLTSLSIIEGNNTHLFFLHYKEKLDPETETLYDFSSKDKLRNETEKLDTPPTDAVSATKESADSIVVVRDSSTQEEHQPSAKEIEDRYSETVINANKAFSSKKYDEAKSLYALAIELKPNDPWSTSQLQNIDNIQNATKVGEVQKASDMSYRNHIKAADNAFDIKSFATAKFEYGEALAEKPADPYAKSQLSKIDQLMKDEAYKSYMSIASDALANQQLENATNAFNEALKIKPNDSDAKKALIKIAVARQASFVNEKQEKTREDKEKQYNDAITLADNMFEAGLYAEAKTKYLKAGKMRPGEEHVQSRISAIDSIMLERKAEANKATEQKAQEQVRNKQYDLAIKQGNAAFKKNEYEVAREFYLQAQQLKPAEEIPTSQLQIIDTKLAENRINELYETFTHFGDSTYIRKDFSSALRWYDSALLMKPDATYPKKQIIAVNQDLLVIAETARKQKRAEEFDKAYPDFVKANALKLDRKFEEAYIAFSEFLNKLDTLNINEYLLIQQSYINQAKDYLTRLDRYKPKPKSDTLVSPVEDDTKKKEDDTKKKKKRKKDTGAHFRIHEKSEKTFLANAGYPILNNRQRLNGIGYVVL